MRKRILWKLLGLIWGVLLVFALSSGIIFTFFFRKHTARAFREDLEHQAQAIAQNLEQREELDDAKIGDYLALVNSIMHESVWIIDRATGEVIADSQRILAHELPSDSLSILESVYSGDTIFSEEYQLLSEPPSFSIGVPVHAGDGSVRAAVLIHVHLSEVENASRTSVRILLVSFAAELAIAGLLTFFAARSFVRPITQMDHVTLAMTEGDYSVRTGIERQDEVGSLARQIDLLAEKLQEASAQSELLEQMRRNYISNISHELRTPVMVLKGSVEAIEDGVVRDPETVREYIRQMRMECDQLNRLINDLLELSRLQNPAYSFEMQETDLREILSDAVRGYRGIAAKQDISIRLETETSPSLIRGDYDRLRQMFRSVLENAVKYAEPHSEVLVLQRSNGSGFGVRIQNRGIGIPPEELSRIFDSFYRGSNSSDIPGTGLGLAIAQQIAERHQIRINVESRPNDVTSFEFTIPAA